MKNKIQMRRAKHMIAIWLKPGDTESLKDALDTARRCWNRSSQRVLRVWAKELYKNPERYEFTGMAMKSLKLKDFFSLDDCDFIEYQVNKIANGSDRDYIIRSVIQHKWVYGLGTEDALREGISVYNGGQLKYRPKKPVLKSIK